MAEGGGRGGGILGAREACGEPLFFRALQPRRLFLTRVPGTHARGKRKFKSTRRIFFFRAYYALIRPRNSRLIHFKFNLESFRDFFLQTLNFWQKCSGSVSDKFRTFYANSFGRLLWFVKILFQKKKAKLCCGRETIWDPDWFTIIRLWLGCNSYWSSEEKVSRLSSILDNYITNVLTFSSVYHLWGRLNFRAFCFAWNFNVRKKLFHGKNKQRSELTVPRCCASLWTEVVVSCTHPHPQSTPLLLRFLFSQNICEETNYDGQHSVKIKSTWFYNGVRLIFSDAAINP